MERFSTFVLRILLALAFIVLQPCAAKADMEADALKGLKSFQVLVEGIKPGCGLNSKEIENSLRFVLSQSRIVVSDGQAPMIYSSVTISGDNCTTAQIELWVTTPVNIIVSKRWTIATIWNKSILVSNNHDLGAEILRQTESLAKRLVVDWSGANPR